MALAAVGAREDRWVDVRLKSPFTAVVSGPTGSGKTVALMKLIALAKDVSDPPPSEIHYCYGVWQNLFAEASETVTFHEGLIDPESAFPKDGKNRWFILDDLMSQLKTDGLIERIFTMYSHHLNLSVFFITQALFREKRCESCG